MLKRLVLEISILCLVTQSALAESLGGVKPGMTLEEATKSAQILGYEVEFGSGEIGLITSKTSEIELIATLRICNGKIQTITQSNGFGGGAIDQIDMYERKFGKPKISIDAVRYEVPGQSGVRKQLTLKWKTKSEILELSISPALYGDDGNMIGKAAFIQRLEQLKDGCRATN